MTQYDLWLKACSEKNEYPYLLKSFAGIFLFQLKIINNPNPNSYNHYHTTYHVWDKIYDKCVFTSTEYQTAYKKYKDYTRTAIGYNLFSIKENE